MKVALIAMDDCSLSSVAGLLRRLHEERYVVRVLTMSGGPVSTDCGLTIAADGSLSSVTPMDYGLVLLSTSASPDVTTDAAESPTLQRFLRQFHARRHTWIAAFGSASVCLARAGLLGGVKYAAHTAPVSSHVGAAIPVNAPVCVDGNVITSLDDATEAFTTTVLAHMKLTSGEAF